MSLINFVKAPNSSDYSVIFESGVNLGKLYLEIDGYYVYWPNLRPGCWSSLPMRIIADKLDELNAEWEATIQKEFSK